MRLLILLILLMSCSSADELEVTLEGEKAEQLLKFYFGSYLNEDPFQVGVLEKRADQFFLDLTILRALSPQLVSKIESRSAGRTFSADSLKVVIQHTYYQARELPQTITEFDAKWPMQTPLIHEVHGPVTRYLRRISIEEKRIQDAVMNYYENGEKLYYPIGTAIKAEHVSEGQVMETTAMIKRFDGFWDFVTYDSTGLRTLSTRPNQRSLTTPTECAGCHFGRKRFEPEQSWPMDAPLAPEGVRKWYTGTRDAQVTEFFSEHVRRSDQVLGVYATAYISDLRMQRSAGVLDSSRIALLNDLGL